MHIESCQFKRTKESSWENGLYVGETDNNMKSVILDKNFRPVVGMFDYRTGIVNGVDMTIPYKFN